MSDGLNLTAQRILDFLREYPNTERSGMNFYFRMGIEDWRDHVNEARELIGCRCGESPGLCESKEHLVEPKKDYLKLVTPVTKNDNSKLIAEIKSKIIALSEQYQLERNLSSKKLLYARTKALELSLNAEVTKRDVAAKVIGALS